MQDKAERNNIFRNLFDIKYKYFTSNKLEEYYEQLIHRTKNNTVKSLDLLEIITKTGVLSLKLYEQIPKITVSEISSEILLSQKEKRLTIM